MRYSCSPICIGSVKATRILRDDRGDLFLIAGALHQNDELIAAEARDDVARAHHLVEPKRRLLQQLVAGFVPLRVVDHLEAVEVDEEHREHASLLARRGERGREQLTELDPIRQGRQRIVGSEILNALLGLLLAGDVAADTAVAREAAVGREHRLAADAEVVAPPGRVGAPGDEIAKRLVALLRDVVLVQRLGFGLENFAGAFADETAEEFRMLVDQTAFEAREAQLPILLPVPVGREIGQRAKARLALAQHRLRVAPFQELSHLVADHGRRLQQALVRLANDVA
jgi:hypothetical protein